MKMNKLHHFLIGKKYGQSTHICLNDACEVVHNYDKNIFSDDDDFTKEYKVFLDSVGLTTNSVFSKSHCSDSLEDAIMSLKVRKNLEALGSDSNFNRVFSNPPQKPIDNSSDIPNDIKEYLERSLAKIVKSAGL